MATYTVHMKQGPNRYEPSPITLTVGDQVVWHNDGGQHNAAGQNGATSTFDTNDVAAGTDSAPVTFSEASAAGGFQYSCTNHHPTMIGHVIVVAAAKRC
jgi:plastocyanin